MFEKVTDPRRVHRWPGSMPVSHRYTAGVAGERFFRALRERGVFLATRCAECGVTYCPARAFCERCLAALHDEIEVGPGGVLESFTVVYRGMDGEPLAEPAVLGLVRLDGADTCLVHRVAEGDEAALEIGQPVEAVLRPEAERTGGLGDILHFRPGGSTPC